MNFNTLQPILLIPNRHDSHRKAPKAAKSHVSAACVSISFDVFYAMLLKSISKDQL